MQLRRIRLAGHCCSAHLHGLKEIAEEQLLIELPLETNKQTNKHGKQACTMRATRWNRKWRECENNIHLYTINTVLQDSRLDAKELSTLMENQKE